MIRSRDGFLSSGVTRACFNSSGNTPDCRDWFTSLVRRWMMAGRTLFSNPVGIGSASQVFAGEESIIFDTSSQLRGRNFTRALEIWRWTGCAIDVCVSRPRRSVLMLDILVMKNLLNISANSWLLCPGGVVILFSNQAGHHTIWTPAWCFHGVYGG